ncbi:MAG: hypothetical protein WBM83_10945, partial [Flavobacteriaceae bacterium]
ATNFPDRVAIFFGKDISVQPLYNAEDLITSTTAVKAAVFNALTQLTTHISDEASYNSTVEALQAQKIDFLYPQAVNQRVAQQSIFEANSLEKAVRPSIFISLLKGLFTLLNFPLLLLWRKVFKPKVWEQEFMGTFRFAYSLASYPIYYLLVLLTVGFLWNFQLGWTIVSCLFLFNWGYVKRIKN